jgi:MFS family permease
MDSARADEQPRPIHWARRSVALIALALFAGTAARSALSPLQELARADIGLNDNQLALLQGFAIALPLALVSIPIGRLVDRSNRARLLLALALLFAVGSVLTAFAHSFATMLVARMLVGGAFAGAVPAAVSLGADLSTTRTRGRVMAIFALGQILGSAATFALVGELLQAAPALQDQFPFVAALAPWRLVQLVFAAAMLVLTAFLTLLAEPVRHEQGTAAHARLGPTLKEMRRYARLLVPLGIGLTTIGMADAAASIWVVPVLTRFFHQQPADFGAWMGLAFVVSGLLGTVAGGALADIGQRVAGARGVLLGAAVAAGISLPAALFPIAPSVTVLAWLFALLLGAGACASVVATSALAVLLPNELRGLSLSLLTAVGLVIAYGLAPSLVSLGAQALGSGDDIRMPLAVVGAVSSAVGCVAFLAAMRVARSTTVSAHQE